MNKKEVFGIDYMPYSEELMQEMYGKRIMGIPTSFFLLDLRRTNTFCHISSDLLVYIMPNSNRVSGEIPMIKAEDKSHSWVEDEQFVYDVTQGIVWKKEIYYRKFEPANTVVHTREQSLKGLSRYLNYTENSSEMYIAWVRDILEGDMENQPYRPYLQTQAQSFSKEKDLDNIEYDEKLANEYLSELREVYKKAQRFLKDSKKEEVDDGNR